jgi:hypothetical protein
MNLKFQISATLGCRGSHDLLSKVNSQIFSSDTQANAHYSAPEYLVRRKLTYEGVALSCPQFFLVFNV